MPRDVQEVELFNGIAGPFGDARLNPFRPGSYESTFHGLITGDGFVPYFVGTNVALPSVVGDWGKAIEWETSTGAPIVLVIGAIVNVSAVAVRINADGTTSADKAFTAGGVANIIPALSAAKHSNGGTTPYIFAALGTGQAMEYRNVAGTWAACTGTPSQVDGVFSENGNLWGVVNGYQVRKWPAGTNPVTGTAGAAIDVGNSAWDITGAGLLGRSYVVFVKPDGIYVYDADAERYENIWAGLAENPHPDTGKGTTAWGSDVFIPIGPSGMVMLTPTLDIIPVSPLPSIARPGPSTPGGGLIRGLAGGADFLYCAAEPYTQRINAGVNMAVRTTQNGSSFNNRDSVSTDDDLSTSFTVSATPGPTGDLEALASTSAIYVKSDARFGGIYFATTPGAISAWVPVLEYWDGNSWESVAYEDHTDSLSRSGVYVPTARIPDDWETTAVNSVTGYWLRLRHSSGSFGTGAVKVYEVRLLPDGDTLPGGSNVTHAPRDDSGLRTHIFRGYRTESGFHWDDIISEDGDVSHTLMLTKLKAAGGGRTLLAIGAREYTRWNIGSRGDPTSEQYPYVQNSFASLLRLAADDRIATDKRAPSLQKGIWYLDVYGRDFDEANDTVEAWARFDGGTPQRIGLARKLPTRMYLEPMPESAKGYEYAVVVALKDGARDQRPPVISRIVAGVYPIPGTPLET